MLSIWIILKLLSFGKELMKRDLKNMGNLLETDIDVSREFSSPLMLYKMPKLWTGPN